MGGSYLPIPTPTGSISENQSGPFFTIFELYLKSHYKIRGKFWPKTSFFGNGLTLTSFYFCTKLLKVKRAVSALKINKVLNIWAFATPYTTSWLGFEDGGGDGQMGFSDFGIFGVILAKIARKNPLIFALIATKICVVFNIIVCKFTQTCGIPPWPPELICSTLVQLLLTGKKLKGLKFFKNFQWILYINIMGFLNIKKSWKIGETDFQKST